MHRRILEGLWGHFEPTGNLGVNLREKTLGVFGLGHIGFEMARLCRSAYDMRIIYHNRKTNPKAEQLLSARWVTFDELLAESDVLSIHAGLSAETKNKFNAETLSKMKSGAILINTARGAIVDEAALTDALKSGHLGGAGLDVCNPEPMSPENPLLNFRNVAITPHIGNAIDTARRRMSVMVAENIIAAGAGKKIPYEV